MVTAREMARAALRYDTVTARAMRRALGICGGPVRRGRASRRAERAWYAGMAECFRNDPVPAILR